MKHKIRNLTVVGIVVLLITMTLASCGGKGAPQGKYAEDAAGSYSNYVYSSEGAREPESPASPQLPSDSAALITGAPPAVPPAISESQKMIFSVQYRMQTMQFDQTLQRLESLIAELGGFVQHSTVTGNDIQHSGYSLRYADYVFRIPTEKLGNFKVAAATLATVTNTQTSAENVTQQYMDTETRIKTLRVKEARLLAMLEKTGELKDLLELENELASTTYEIESLQTSLSHLDSLVNYSTITVDIQEVLDEAVIQPNPPTSLRVRMAVQFKQSMNKLVLGVQNFLVGIVGNLHLLIVLAILLLIVAIVRRGIKKGSLQTKIKKGHKNKPGQAPIPPEAQSTPDQLESENRE